MCQGKKRRKEEGKSEKIEESEKRKERKGQRKIEKRNAVKGLLVSSKHILVSSVNISTPTSSHIRESYYSFSYNNLCNYLFINEFQFNKKVVLKMIK